MTSPGWIFGSAALALMVAACGGSKGATGTGTTGTTSTTGSGGAAGTGGAGTGGSTATSTTSTTGTGGGTSACTPTGGSAVVPMACDTFQLAVLHHTGGPTDLRLTGRLFGESAPMPACAAIDGVDILTGGVGSPVVQHLAGGQTVALDNQEELIATGTSPVMDIDARCASDDPAQRFDVYGFVVTGRVDGGTFQAKCALAEGGFRWPPALRVTCHDNVDLPARDGDIIVTNQMFMGMSVTTAQLSASDPHSAGGALQTIDATLHVIPWRDPSDPGQPIPPHDTTGWMTAVTETLPPSAPASQMSFFAGSNPLGSDLCPPAPTTPPGPGFIPAPVFLARATGTGQHGAFSTELFVGACLSNTIP